MPQPSYPRGGWQTLHPTATATASTSLLHTTIPASTGSWISSVSLPLVGSVARRFHNYSSGSTKLRLVAHCQHLFFVRPTLAIYKAYRRRLISRQYHLLPDDAMADNNGPSLASTPSMTSPSIASTIPSPSDPEKGLISKSPSETASHSLRRRILIWTGIGIAVAAITALGMCLIVRLQ